MTEIHNYLQVTEEDLPCLCKVSNVSENYLREFGEVHLVVDIITEPYGSRVFLFNKLFAIVDTDKQELFIDPPKLTKTVMKYVQSLLYYFGLDIYIYADKEEHLFLKDSKVISTDYLLVNYGEFKYEEI